LTRLQVFERLIALALPWGALLRVRKIGARQAGY